MTRATRVSIGNAELNGLHGAVRFETAGSRGALERRRDVVLANIQADILIRHAAALAGPSRRAVSWNERILGGPRPDCARRHLPAPRADGSPARGSREWCDLACAVRRP